MENKKIKKTTLAIILISVLGVLSIAYAALSTTLNIQSDSSTKVDPWVVQFNDAAGSVNSINGYLQTEGTPVNAKGGTVTISSAGKTNDTATISGTELYDYGAEVIYHLEVLNKGTRPAYLETTPLVTLNETNTTSNGKEFAGEDIVIVLYKNAACTDPVKSADTIAAATDGGPGKLDWYVKVSYKAYGDETGETSNPLPEAATDFTFAINPVWVDTNPQQG